LGYLKSTLKNIIDTSANKLERSSLQPCFFVNQEHFTVSLVYPRSSLALRHDVASLGWFKNRFRIAHFDVCTLLNLLNLFGEMFAKILGLFLYDEMAKFTMEVWSLTYFVF
jgi:hypothetical protein